MTTSRKNSRRRGAAPRSTAAPSPGLARVALPDLPMGSGATPHPAIGLGLWALGRWTLEDEAHTKATIGRALERGVRWFDTAEVYGTGRSERLLGDVLARAAPTDPPPFIVTKVSWDHLRPSQVRAAVIGSLQRLNRSSVDIYLVHAPDERVPIAETMAALESLWKEKRIGAIGVSNFSTEQLEDARRALSEAEIVVNQVRYNLFDREDGDQVLEYCRRHSIAVEAYTPLARGLLMGRFLDGERPSSDVRRFSHRMFEGDRYPEVIRRAKSLRELAERERVPMGSLAIHWLLRRGAAVVFGASRPEQVDRTLEAVATRPTDAAIDAADEICRGVFD